MIAPSIHCREPLMSRDPRIDAYIAAAPAFAQPILVHLRAAIHAACPAAEETIKWTMPAFLYKGEQLVLTASFKSHVALVFPKGELVTGQSGGGGGEDGGGGVGSRGGAMGQFGRIRSIDDLPDDEALAALIHKAMALTDQGIKPARRPRPPLGTPEDLRAALDADAAAAATFGQFTAAARRDYVEWIVEAKRPETRARRIAQAVAWLAEGKKRHWKHGS
jgi:uncharacterized protein YdeI (YjbR/CyaY-like superfamily)